MKTRGTLIISAMVVVFFVIVLLFVSVWWTFPAVVLMGTSIIGVFKLRDLARGWRIRHDAMSLNYEEKIGNNWIGIPIVLERRGHSPFAVHYRTAAEWQQYPDWASNRREEIIDRIKKACPGLQHKITEAEPAARS